MFYSLNENVTESVEDIMKNDEIVASPYEDFTEGAMAIVAESEENFSNLMEYIGMNEAAQFAETGEPVVYTEASFAEIKAKIRSFIDKIIEKIKSLFKRAILFFDQHFKADSEFVKKYKKRIDAASTTDLEFKGYPFSKAADLSFKDPASTISALSAIKDKDEYDDLINSFCKALAGKDCDKSDFKSTVFEQLHGSDTKEDLSGKDLDLKEAVLIITGTSKTKTALNKQKDAAISSLNKLKNSYEKADLSGKSDEEKNTNTYKISMARDVSGLVTTLFGEMITAVKDLNAQSRALCAKAMVKSKVLTRESATIEHPAYEGFFDGFDMI